MDTAEGIRPGLEARLERVVEGELLTHHVGGQGTFSTPAMVGLMEITSHRAIERLLPEGQTSVGYEICVRHMAPSPPGSTVVVISRVTEVKGTRIYFAVECRDGDTILGSGTHKRAVVPATF
ncbi:MAG TPA: thioesterase family protein [Candidatus Udaeobacter sp.]|nr:thioesterase family protein [Candidatus Udaeobacter sp.]